MAQKDKGAKNLQDMKIDLVYLWVDGNDKEWQKKRDYWAEKLGVNGNPENNNCRFIDNEELRYSLRSAEMYAPWINKIFIVTDGQVPKWLDVNHPKIRIVDHKEIMPEECLPCFNSEAIETCIANIPELSEYFLCANDDKFFASPVSPDYFFDENNKPIVNFRPQSWSKDEIIRSLYKQSYIETVETFNRHFAESGIDYKKYEPFHCIEAYRKSYYLDCKNEFKNEFFYTAQKKFRAARSIQRPIVDLYMVEKKNCTFKINPAVIEQNYSTNVDNLYLAINSIKEIKKCIRKKNPKLLCLNDGENIAETDRKNIKFLLEELYFQKPEWEIDCDEFLIEPLSKEFLPIVFAFNNIYTKYFGVLLASLIKNSSSGQKYDLIILHSDIEEKNKKLLINMLPNNFSLRFFDVSSLAVKFIKNYDNFQYWSKEIYYRLFIPILMQKYSKVLYLDSDIIINQCIDNIFETDFENKDIVAIKDPISPTLHLDKNSERFEHIRNSLGIKNTNNYFNSGVLLFNIPNINVIDYTQNLQRAISINNFQFPDQDILNVIFENRIKLISQKWNYCCGTLIWNERYLNEICGDFKKDFFEARSFPVIIHYTSPKKPWNAVDEDFFNVFWQYARHTDFYEELLYQMCRKTTQDTLKEEMKNINLLTNIGSEKRTVLWGASLFLENFINKYQIYNANIAGIIDKNKSRSGEFLGRYKIYNVDDLSNLNPERIIITIVNSAEERAKEITEYLKANGYTNIEVITI